jgi:hypothetical protein
LDIRGHIWIDLDVNGFWTVGFWKARPSLLLRARLGIWEGVLLVEKEFISIENYFGAWKVVMLGPKTCLPTGKVIRNPNAVAQNNPHGFHARCVFRCSVCEWQNAASVAEALA